MKFDNESVSSVPPRPARLREALGAFGAAAWARVTRALHLRAAALLLLPLAIACSDDPVGPGGDPGREVGVVVNSIDLSLSIFDLDDPASVRTVGIGPDGSPVSLAVRGGTAAVPLGIVPAVAVVDLETARLVHTVALPSGSGATGAAFVNDSIVLVANPNLGTVSPVNVRAGTLGESIEVGRFPQAVVAAAGRAFVLNAELENFVPAGPSTVSVIDPVGLDVVATVSLGGENAAAGAVGPDGLLYVVQSGRFGEATGALSLMDPGSLSEVSFVDGFGEFPGSVAVAPDGRVYVGAFGVGTLVWRSGTGSFERGPEYPLTPGGVASTSGVAVDPEGRVWVASPDCQAPAAVHRLDDGLNVEVSVPVGICPAAIGFGFTEGG